MAKGKDKSGNLTNEAASSTAILSLDPDSELDYEPETPANSSKTVGPVMPLPVVTVPVEVPSGPPPVAFEPVLKNWAVSIPTQTWDESKSGHMTRHVDLRLSRQQARTLKGIFNALHVKHERMANGKHVDSVNHAVMWVLDQVGAAFEEAASA